VTVDDHTHTTDHTHNSRRTNRHSTRQGRGHTQQLVCKQACSRPLQYCAISSVSIPLVTGDARGSPTRPGYLTKLNPNNPVGCAVAPDWASSQDGTFSRSLLAPGPIARGSPRAPELWRACGISRHLDFPAPPGWSKKSTRNFVHRFCPYAAPKAVGRICRAMPPPPPDDLQTGGELPRSYDLVSLKYERLKPTLHADQPQ
jgi:hypothetical protein